MSWWVAGATAGSAVLGAVSSSRSSRKASEAQTSAEREAIAAQERQFERQLELLEPFRQAGLPGLEGLSMLSTPEGQADFYSQYYQSPQFAAQSNAAQNAQLASAEATGGLQSTSTQNQLARIAPTLGLQALEQQQNTYGNLANIGLSGAGSQAGYSQQFGAAQGAGLQNIGAHQAGNYLAQGQASSGLFNTLGGLGYGRLTGAW